MKSSENKMKRITGILLIVYLLVLSWIILFKMQLSISELKNMNFRSINLIPFSESVIVNGKVDISEILLNIVAFVPFGIYISMLKPNWNFGKKVLPIFCVSLAYEIIQFIFAIGGSDITDLIGNTLGGVIGIGIFVLLYGIFGKKVIKGLNVLATIGTVVMVLLLGFLVVVNM